MLFASHPVYAFKGRRLFASGIDSCILAGSKALTQLVTSKPLGQNSDFNQWFLKFLHYTIIPYTLVYLTFKYLSTHNFICHITVRTNALRWNIIYSDNLHSFFNTARFHCYRLPAFCKMIQQLSIFPLLLATNRAISL